MEEINKNRRISKRILVSCLFVLGLLTPNVNIAQEICYDGIDNDGDGLIDLQDTVDCNCGSIVTTCAEYVINGD